ncbi:hypothetical protein GCM10029964_092030 [Kibdelosporangium lantanae]
MSAAVDQLLGALADATDADLTHTNLTGVPLDGVVWSSRTRWPHHMESDIRRRSAPIGPDLYRIGARGTDASTTVDLNV